MTQPNPIQQSNQPGLAPGDYENLTPQPVSPSSPTDPYGETARAKAAEAFLQAQITALQAGGVTPPPVPAQFHRTTFQGLAADATTDAPRIRLAVVQADSVLTGGPFDGIGYATALKAVSPNIKCFFYMEACRTRASDPRGIAVVPGVPDSQMLHNQSGAQFGNSSGNVIDPGNASFQAALIAHILDVMTWGPFDGVYLDEMSPVFDFFLPKRVDHGCTVTSGSDVVADPAVQAGDFGRSVTGPGIPANSFVGTVTAGVSFLLSSTSGSQTNVNATENRAGTDVTITDYCATYANPTDFQNALIGLGTAVTAALHAAGKQTLGNVNVGAAGAAVWESVVAVLDGAMIQGFGNLGTGIAASIWQWNANLAQLVWAEANGKISIPTVIDATNSGAVFALATLLLASNGNCSLDLDCKANESGGRPGTSGDVWWPEFATAQQLGPASGAYTITAGLYARNFLHGNVKVNPTNATIAGVPAYTGQINYTG